MDKTKDKRAEDPLSWMDRELGAALQAGERAPAWFWVGEEDGTAGRLGCGSYLGF
jgi:hypothetical protein